MNEIWFLDYFLIVEWKDFLTAGVPLNTHVHWREFILSSADEPAWVLHWFEGVIRFWSSFSEEEETLQVIVLIDSLQRLFVLHHLEHKEFVNTVSAYVKMHCVKWTGLFKHSEWVLSNGHVYLPLD